MPKYKLDECANLFLEAAYDPQRLGEALEASANYFGGEAAQIVTLNNVGEIVSATSIGMDLNEAAKQSEYVHISPRFQALSVLKEKEITFDFASLTRAEIEKHPLYQEYLKPNGVNWYAGTTLVKDSQNTVGFGLFRDDGIGHYSRSELEDFRWLSDKASEAAKLALKLDAIKLKSRFEMMEEWSLPVAALTSDCQIIDMSEEFYETLKRHNLGSLSAVGHIKFDNPMIAKQLRSQVLIFVDAFSPRLIQNKNEDIVFIAKTGELLELKLHPIPSNSRWSAAGACALLTIRTIKRKTLDPNKICLALGLTAAEGELAALIAQGVSLKDAAKHRKTRYETARGQLKSIYSKTGLFSQGQLIVLIKDIFPS